MIVGRSLGDARDAGVRLLTACLWTSSIALGVIGLAFKSADTGLAVALSMILNAGPTWYRIRHRSDDAARMSFGVAAALHPALFVYLFRGHPWQMDMHMYFFAALAALTVLYDRRPLCLAAAIIVVHHLLLQVTASSWAFSGNADMGRVLLHAGIICLQTIVLTILTGRLVNFIKAYEAARDRSDELATVAAASEERARAALADLDVDYRLLADYSNDLIVRMNLDGVRLYVSPAALAVLGRTPEEMLGEATEDDIHPDDRSGVIATRQTLLSGADNPICTYRQRNGRGDYVWLEASYRLIRHPTSAKPSEFIATVRDVSSRHQAELDRAAAMTELQENHRLLLMAEEMGGVGHWRLDFATGEVTWSDVVCAIHGVENGHLPAFADALDAYHPDDRPLVRERMEAARRTNCEYEFGARLIRPDGTTRYVISRGRPELRPDGTTSGLVGVFQDVTDAREAETAIGEARERAEEAARYKAHFLADMSHELRTPMNGVVGFTDLLLAGDLSSDQRRRAELIAESGRSMVRLLNDILDLSKIEAGRMIVAAEPFDLCHALDACAKLVRPAVEQKGVALRCDVPQTLPRFVRGDGLRLRQVILNLLGNAAKFTTDGSITLRARIVQEMAGPVLSISVEDTGIGIPPDRQTAIFEEFVQADASIAPRFGGTGLGLSISARLARLMGGELRLESEGGQGSCFTLILPFLPVEEQPVVREVAIVADQTKRALSHAINVLVAEDHDINQYLIADMLDRLGCRHALARHGGEALDMVRKAAANGDPYSVILMDMQMPEMDGLEATRQIRRSGFPAINLPIVALTANAYAEDVKACLAAGMQAHLSKPVRLADLETALRDWTGASIAASPDFEHSPRLWAKYLKRKADALARLDELVTEREFSDDAVNLMVGLLHKLAGTAAMFDDDEIGERARRLENDMRTWNADERADRIPAGVAHLTRAA